jgi:hypothetical protein
MTCHGFDRPTIALTALNSLLSFVLIVGFVVQLFSFPPPIFNRLFPSA